MPKFRIISSLLFVQILFSLSGQTNLYAMDLVSKGSTWKYLDDGSNLGNAWQQPNFDDSGWNSGAGQLGYGDGDEATVLNFGGDGNNKYVTTYFRHSFNVANAIQVPNVNLHLLKDDGAIVYLNGTEVHRTNMPTGVVDYLTLAAGVVGNENIYEVVSLPQGALVNGTNIITVEIHQASVTSSDISFDLQLSAIGESDITRGPYLQSGTSTSIHVRWRTATATDSVVSTGSSINNLVLVASDNTVVTEHELTLSGLLPNTKYYYSVGTSKGPLVGNDENHYFVTAPAYDSKKPTRIWVLGDSGTANADAAAVKNAYLAYSGNQSPDVWLMLGDNAYNNGTDNEYQAAVFDMYPTILQQTVLWATLGNHDAITSNVYYDIFSFPINGEANGTSSGTEAYYSFDYSNIHFISLDSMTKDRFNTMMTWLETDLSNTVKEWIIVFFHHPPYTKGSHDSDNVVDSGGRMRDMREIALPILEKYGVDLVLSGHSHSYERSFLLRGHFGSSTTLAPAMILDGGDGRSNGDGAYDKTSSGNGANGTVYTVAGSSGKVGRGNLNHPAMYIGLKALGSLVIDIKDAQLYAVFLDSKGVVQDNFRIVKSNSVSNTPPTAVAGSDIVAQTGDIVQFDARDSFDRDGNIVSYAWDNGLNGQQPSKVYDVTGVYTIILTVIDNDGAIATDSLTVTINEKPGGNNGGNNGGGNSPTDGIEMEARSGRIDFVLLILLALLAIRRQLRKPTIS